MKVALASVHPVGPIQFWLVRNSPGVRFEPRTLTSNLEWISRIRRRLKGSVPPAGKLVCTLDLPFHERNIVHRLYIVQGKEDLLRRQDAW